MKRRKWKPGQKALIVLEGLKGRPIGELCAEHEISQAQYYQWRDQLLANAAKAFGRPMAVKLRSEAGCDNGGEKERAPHTSFDTGASPSTGAFEPSLKGALWMVTQR